MTPTPKAEPPRFRLADVVRSFGAEVRRGAALLYQQGRALLDIERCRTAALGGHSELYDCGHVVTAYNSCRSRSCPRCQAFKARDWVVQKALDLLPIPYFHVVFTLPKELADVPPMARATLYNALFRASSATLLEFGHRHLGGQIGFVSVLHTWGQALTHHPHVHCVVAGGGWDRKSKVFKKARRGFLFSVGAMSAVFRGKLLADLLKRGLPGLDGATLARVLAAASRHNWVVYSKKPFGGPKQVLRYLARYTHRIAISEHRLRNVTEKTVTFDWKDYRDGKTKQMTLPGAEFLRRFLQHVPVRGCTRVRSFGFLANSGKRENLLGIRAALAAAAPTPKPKRVCVCPVCGVGVLVTRQMLAPWTPLPRSDTS